MSNMLPDSILRQNPHLDRGRLEEVQRLLKYLNRVGVSRNVYGLVSPLATPVRGSAGGIKESVKLSR